MKETFRKLELISVLAGMNKGDLIWFTGLSLNISKRVIDYKDPMSNVGPSLEYLKYKLKKENSK